MIYNRYIKIAISVIIILIFVLPNSLAFGPMSKSDITGNWQYVFVWESLELILMYSLVTLSWVLLFFLKSRVPFQLFNAIFILLCFLLFLAFVFSLVVPLQDFAPSYGTFLSGLLLPIALLNYFPNVGVKFS